MYNRPFLSSDWPVAQPLRSCLHF